MPDPRSAARWTRGLALTAAVFSVLAAGTLANPPAALAATTLAASPSPAGEVPATFGIHPGTAKGPDARTYFSYTATPGGVVKDFVVITNYSAAPVTLRVGAGDAYNTEGGGFAVVDERTRSQDAGAWIAVAARTVSIAARAQAVVPFQVAVPPTVSPGDHAGGVMVSLSSRQHDAKGNVVTVVQRVGARVYLRIPGPLKPRLEIRDLTAHYVRHGWNPMGSFTLEYTVVNAGNVRLSARQTAVISAPLTGATSDNLADVQELLPGNSVRVHAEFANILPLFHLDARVSLDPFAAAGSTDPNLPAVVGVRGVWILPAVIGMGVLVLLSAAALGFRFSSRRSIRVRKSSTVVKKEME